MAQIRTSFSVSYRVRKTSALNATVASCSRTSTSR
jgi:hypothetical protein